MTPDISTFGKLPIMTKNMLSAKYKETDIMIESLRNDGFFITNFKSRKKIINTNKNNQEYEIRLRKKANT